MSVQNVVFFFTNLRRRPKISRDFCEISLKFRLKSLSVKFFWFSKISWRNSVMRFSPQFSSKDSTVFGPLLNNPFSKLFRFRKLLNCKYQILAVSVVYDDTYFISPDCSFKSPWEAFKFIIGVRVVIVASGLYIVNDYYADCNRLLIDCNYSILI